MLLDASRSCTPGYVLCENPACSNSATNILVNLPPILNCLTLLLFAAVLSPSRMNYVYMIAIETVAFSFHIMETESQCTMRTKHSVQYVTLIRKVPSMYCDLLNDLSIWKQNLQVRDHEKHLKSLDFVNATSNDFDV